MIEEFFGSLPDAFKTIGAAAGIGTASFTIYDRMIRNRPLASLVFRHAGPLCLLYVRVRNVADRPILIDDIESSRPEEFVPGVDEAFSATFVPTYPFPLGRGVIAPKEDRDFQVLIMSRLDDPADRGLTFSISWRIVGRGIGFFRHPSLKIRTSTAELLHMKEDADRRHHARR